MLNLDTHMVVYAVTGVLRAPEEALMSREPWSVSAIVLWELAKLVQLNRIDMEFDNPRVLRALNSLRVWPIDLAVARASTRLDFRSDPADEIIAATSVVHGIPLLTRDRHLLKSKVIPLARLS